MPASSFLEGITRRPQRLILGAILFLLLLSFTTYLSFSSSGVEAVRNRWGALGWSGAQPNSLYPPPSPPKTVADMYTHNPGLPTDANELAKWATKGDDGNLYPPSFVPQQANQGPRAKAGFIVLVRNGELKSMRDSMRNGE